MKLSPEEAWAGTLESMVDSRVVFYLKRYNRDYQDYSRQMKELCEKYPAIIQLIDGNNGVTLNDEEYQVFKTYSELSSNREMLEMEFRCPDAEVIGNVVVKDYRLVFRGNSRGNGVASILPEQGEQVSGVLWSITEKCEKSLDYYEGYPYLYGKQDILVQCEDGQELYAAVYIMNEPYQSQPALPGKLYLEGILEGCRQNGLSENEIQKAVHTTRKEMKKQEKKKESHGREVGR